MTRPCTDRLLSDLDRELNSRAPNQHRYPISIGQHNGNWSVVVEVDSKAGSFDVDVEEPTLIEALHTALGQVRRLFGAAA